MSITFTQIGSTDDVFFWELLEFNSKLYAGTYGYPKAYNYPPWTHIKNFDAGESITGMCIFLGKLYATSENLGYIYRMNTADPMDWTRVHDDAWMWVFDPVVFGNYLYCDLATSGTNDHKVLRSSDGDTWNQVAYWSNMWLGSGVVFNNELYMTGQEYTNNYPWAKKSSNGTIWVDASDLCLDFVGAWFGRGVVFANKLFLGMAFRPDNKAKIYKYDGSTLTEVFSFSTEAFCHCQCGFNGYLYAIFGPNMNSDSPGSVTYYLYRSPTGESGTWSFIKSFTANRKLSHGKYRALCHLGVFANALYVGIQDKVYRMFVTFQFATSDNGTDWSAWQNNIADCANSRYIKVKASFSRDDLLSAMPTLEDMTVGYFLKG